MISDLTSQTSGLWAGNELLLLLKVTVVLLAAMLAGFVVRKQAAGHRYLLWVTVLLGILVLPFAAAVVPAIRIPVNGDSALQLFSTDRFIADTEYRVYISRALFWTWLTFALGFLLHLIAGLLKTGAVTRRAVSCNRSEVSALLNTHIHNMGVRRRVVLKISGQIHSPVSWGLFKPVILLPETGTDLSHEQLSAIFAHELGHIVRNDWLILVLARLALALYWFHPLVWWVNAKVNEESELACDDAVVLDHSHTDYAATLVTIARQEQRGTMLSPLVKAMASTFLGRRVHSVLDADIFRARDDGLFLPRAVLTGVVLACVMSSLVLVPETKVSAPRMTISLIRPEPVTRPERLLSASFVPAAGINRPSREDFKPLPPVPVIETLYPRFQPQTEYSDSVGFPVVTMEAAVAKKPTLPRILLQQGIPIYPDEARARGAEGKVLAAYDILPDGSIINVQILNTDQAGVFDRAVLEALQAYRYNRLSSQDFTQENSTHVTKLFTFRIDTDPG